MKFTAILSLFAASSAAFPTPSDLEVRQAGSITRNDLSNGAASSCPPVIFIYARGSTESGNLVSGVVYDLRVNLTDLFREHLDLELPLVLRAAMAVMESGSRV
jgi:hypothetical protein